MDSVKELDERSNSFFDEQDEEKILAEINRRYQKQSNLEPVGDSLPKGNGAMSTEQFMREMGVESSDVVKTNQMPATDK